MKKTLQRTLFTACLHLLLLLSTNAQGWERVYAPDIMMAITSVYQTQDHGYLTTGFNLNGGPYRVMKTDSAGNIVWYHDYYGPTSGTFSNITQDGGLAIIGNGTLIDSFDHRSIGLSKISSNGQQLWYKTIHNYFDDQIEGGDANVDLDTTNNGGFICVLNAYDSTYHQNGMFVTRVDSNGNVVWEKSYFDSVNYSSKYIFTIRNSGDGGFLASLIIDSSERAILLKIDSAGNELWTDTAQSLFKGLYYPVVAHDGNILLMGNASIRKINQSGQLLWQTDYPQLQDSLAWFGNMVEKANNTYAILLTRNTGGAGEAYKFLEVNEAGQILVENPISTARLSIGTQPLTIAYKIFSPTNDGGYIAGAFLQNDPNNYSALLIKMDSSGIVYPNEISGTAYADINQSCTQDSGEFGLQNMVISFTAPNDTFQVATDANGHYWAELDTGNYQILATPLSPYWNGESCNAAQLNFGTPHTDTVLNFAMSEVVNCPYITVDGGIFHIRTCISGYYYAQYCNEGTAPLNGGIVEVDVDTLLVVDSLSVPLLYTNGNQYYFAADTLPLFDCRTFLVYFHTPCDPSLNDRTACIRTAITPNTVCVVPGGWDQSNLRMTVSCRPQQDSVSFTLQNTGTGSMSNSEMLMVIEDNVILLSVPVQLNPGETLSLSELANGSTYRATVPQTPNNPVADFTTAAVEGCVPSPQTPISKGYILDYPINGVNAFEHITCNEINNSYDPNSKSVVPLGVGDNHLIDSSTALEYMIQFQNTGNDTAYQVVVVDSLSPYLDPSTIKLGISSFKCNFSITGNGILTFTFVNIDLPDSGYSQMLSTGFVQFTIKPRANCPIGTVINNDVAIFFDYNPAIITNTVFNTIGQLTVTAVEGLLPDKQVLITAYPNPFGDKATIVVTGGDFHALQLSVYDLTGRKMEEQRIENSTQFTLYSTGLAAGNYLFEIKSGELLVGRGKIAVQ